MLYNNNNNSYIYIYITLINYITKISDRSALQRLQAPSWVPWRFHGAPFGEPIQLRINPVFCFKLSQKRDRKKLATCDWGKTLNMSEKTIELESVVGCLRSVSFWWPYRGIFLAISIIGGWDRVISSWLLDILFHPSQPMLSLQSHQFFSSRNQRGLRSLWPKASLP